MKPCSSCPFTPSATLGKWAPHHLIAISYLLSGDSVLGTMGCHFWDGSHPGRMPEDSPACGGWIRVARETPTIRLMMATGQINPDEPYSDLENLFPDVETMLRWNGIDVDRLPPLKCPPVRTAEDVVNWQRSILDLKARIDANQEVAWAYVLPGSPMTFGVDDDAKPKMPARKLNAWIKKCEKWSAIRTARIAREEAAW